MSKGDMQIQLLRLGNEWAISVAPLESQSIKARLKAFAIKARELGFIDLAMDATRMAILTK